MVMCSGVCEIVFVVESWIIAVKLDGSFSSNCVFLTRPFPSQTGRT